MADKNNQSSLERSHSKKSNAKLTFLVILGAIGFALLWLGVGLLVKGTLPVFTFNIYYVGFPLLGAGLVLLILSYVAVAKFTR